MVELKRLEELRTRREVEDYFKQLGKEITEEEIDALKQSYDKTQESNGALTLQQLDNVAGGALELIIRFCKEPHDCFPEGKLATLTRKKGITLDLGVDLCTGAKNQVSIYVSTLSCEYFSKGRADVKEVLDRINYLPPELLELLNEATAGISKDQISARLHKLQEKFPKREFSDAAIDKVTAIINALHDRSYTGAPITVDAYHEVGEFSECGLNRQLSDAISKMPKSSYHDLEFHFFTELDGKYLNKHEAKEIFENFVKGEVGAFIYNFFIHNGKLLPDTSYEKICKTAEEHNVPRAVFDFLKEKKELIVDCLREEHQSVEGYLYSCDIEPTIISFMAEKFFDKGRPTTTSYEVMHEGFREALEKGEIDAATFRDFEGDKAWIERCLKPWNTK